VGNILDLYLLIAVADDDVLLLNKMFARSPTSPTTVGNVQTAIAIRKMDACISPEDVLNTRYKSVSSTMCVLYTSIL